MNAGEEGFTPIPESDERLTDGNFKLTLSTEDVDDKIVFQCQLITEYKRRTDMAIRSSDQISIIDVTDAYSVMLTTDSYTFPGTTTAAIAGSVSTQINAMCGADSVNASVTVSEITKPTGISIQSDGDAASPTLTISVDIQLLKAVLLKYPYILVTLLSLKALRLR